jgi:hypothetical protein
VTTDASGTGWGAICGEQTAQGLWSTIEKTYRNNVLELLAGGFGVQSFEAEVQGKIVQLNMDNTTAVSYINKMGGSKVHLMRIAQKIWNWCLERKVTLTAQYLPGVNNQAADKLSRQLKDRSDWKLHPDIFQRLNKMLGPYEIDLFASRLNKQIEQFFSWHPEPEAKAVDAFKQNWTHIHGWANPPFNQIGRVISKVLKDKARITLIAPIWPTQAWFADLLMVLEDWPILLPNLQDLFLPGFLGNDLPLHNPYWRVAAWPICGIMDYSKEFQKDLWILLHQEEKRLQEQTMNMDGEYSHNGGTNKILQMNIFRHLEW